MPRCGEDDARAFYGDRLGLTEVAKPAPLAARGGVWFERGALRVHLGVEEPFQPARKAHPAFEVADIDALAARLDVVRWNDDLPGYRRFYTKDPFGNRIEILQPKT